MASKIHAYALAEDGGAAGAARLQPVSADKRAPAAGEVRVAAQYIGLNRADLMYVSGAYLLPPKPGTSGGYEVAGRVESVGAGVTTLAAGDYVSSVPGFSLHDYGVFSEYPVLPAASVRKCPPALRGPAGASWTMQYYTAYGGLVAAAGVKKGDYVLITAATGSMGVSSIQVAAMLGAVSIVTTRSPDKVAWLKSVGADHVVVTSEQDLAEAVKEITADAGGVNVVFDPIAGAAVETYAAMAAPGAVIVVYGALSGEPATPFPLFPALMKGLTMRGYTLFELTSNPDGELFQAASKFIDGGIESGALKPVVGHTFEFDQLVEALEFLDSGKVQGKVVVKTAIAE